MGKGKSELDLSRIEFFRKEMRRRYALFGPFRCPNCHNDKSLSSNLKILYGKESYTVEDTGEERVREIKISRFIFRCSECKLTEVVRLRGSPDVIDAYNDFYDDQLSEHDKQSQVSMIKERPIRVLELPSTKVIMK